MTTFVSELRRRNVFRVAAAYAVVAWILIEAGSVLMPTFGAPDWVFKVYVIVVGAGFLLSLVFAWVFELTPEGLKLERDVDRTTSMTQQTGRKLDFAIISLLVIALAISLTLNITGMRAPDEGIDRLSIAVLPFTSRSADPENELFADGIHDDLLTRLANISALKVISRTSVMKYRDTSKNLREIAEQLGVGTVIEGAVQRVGDNVRINAQLIDAQTDEHLWARTYDRQLSAENIFAIQSEISEAIARELRATLSEQERGRLAEIPTENLAAYNLYMKGRANLHERTLDTIQQARQQFEQAVALDPEYAEAYAGLADAVQLLFINHNVLSMREASELARQALDEALALDPDLADAYASLGLLHTTVWRFDRTGPDNLLAEAAFRKAIELNPNHAQAIMWFASLRASEEKFDEAIELYNRSLELDPLARIPYASLPALYAQKGRNQKALEYWLKGIEIHPEWPHLYENVAIHLQGLGRLDEAIAWGQKARELSTDPLHGLNIIGAYLELGDTEKAVSLMSTLQISPEHPFYHFGHGIAAYFLKEYDTSIEVFEAAMARADSIHPFMFDIVSNAALLAGDYDRAYRYVVEHDPALAGLQALVVDRTNARDVIKAAYINQQRGNDEIADDLLEAALPVIREAPRLGMAGHGIRDVQILALQGRTVEALDTLQQAIDAGFRGSLFHENWTLADDPYLSLIRDHPRFEAMQAQIAAFNADMRANVQQAALSDSWDDLLALAAQKAVL